MPLLLPLLLSLPLPLLLRLLLPPLPVPRLLLLPLLLPLSSPRLMFLQLLLLAWPLLCACPGSVWLHTDICVPRCNFLYRIFQMSAHIHMELRNCLYVR